MWLQAAFPTIHALEGGFSQPTPGTALRCANVPQFRLCPAQPQPEGPSWELKDRSWEQQGGEEGNPSCQELPAHGQERQFHPCSTCVSPALPCWEHGAVQAELDCPLWLGGSGHPLPGACNAGGRGNERSREGMEELGGNREEQGGNGGTGREWRSWESPATPLQLC